MKKQNIRIGNLGMALAAMLILTSAYSGRFNNGGNVWIKAGSKPADYDMGVTSSEHHSGSKCAFIKSKIAKISGFGTYMQTSAADAYLGKSVQMTGWIKSKDVKDWAGMWMRVDGPNPYQYLSFDNMQNRPITGTTDWKECTIVLDVPDSAKDLAFGVLLSGTGEVYFDDISFKILGPATGNKGPDLMRGPSDLNFDN